MKFKVDDLVVVDDEVMIIIGIDGKQYHCMNHNTNSDHYYEYELKLHKGDSLYDEPKVEE